MRIPKPVLEEIGRIAVEATWLEVIAASLAGAGLNEALEIAAHSGAAIRRGRKVARSLADPDLRDRCVAWVDETERLIREGRHPIVHGLAHTDEAGAWATLHLKTGRVHALDPERLADVRRRMEEHVAAGWRVNVEVWEQRQGGPATEDGAAAPPAGSAPAEPAP
jgi:hypothetical protein